jgi:oligopeptide transport system permease protein
VNPVEPDVQAALDPGETVDPGRGGAWWRVWIQLRRNPLAMGALAVIVLFVLAALIGPFIYRTSPTTFDPLTAQLDTYPSPAHPLGTDFLGRDILARILAGLRVSLGAVLLVETINIVFGSAVGLLAGYLGGWVDAVLSRIADLLLAFPGLLLAFLFAGVFGPGVGTALGGFGRLAIVASALALVSWPLMARYVRAESLSLRSREFVTAAVAMGVDDSAIMVRHLLPNVIGLVLTASTLDMASVVVNEAVLSLLGLGVQAPNSSIGLMIDNAVPVLDQNWTEALFPGIVLTIMVLAFSFLGDGLRDAVDARTRE